MSTSRRTPTPSAFLNANQSGDGKPDWNIKFHVRFLLFPEALKKHFTVILTNTSDIELHADMVEKFDPFYYYYTPLHKKSYAIAAVYNTEMHKDLSHDVCQRIHYISWKESVVVFTPQSDENWEFRCVIVLCPFARTKSVDIQQKNDTSSFATTRVVVAKETTPSVCFSQYIIK